LIAIESWGIGGQTDDRRFCEGNGSGFIYRRRNQQILKNIGTDGTLNRARRYFNAANAVVAAAFLSSTQERVGKVFP
jgi:hypothetical protein